MRLVWTKAFWKDTAERVIFTVAQVLIALFTVDGFNLANIDLAAMLVTVGTTAILVVLKSIVAAAAVKNAISPASVIKE